MSHEIKQAAPEGVPRGTLLTFRDTPVRGKRAAHEFSITDMQVRWSPPRSTLRSLSFCLALSSLS